MMKLKRREAGASMVMVAVMMSVLLTLVAGTISFAAGSSQRVDLQNSADNTARAIMKECIKILTAGNVNSAGCPVSNTPSPWMLNKLRSGAGAAGANMTLQIDRQTIGGIANAPYRVTVSATRANTAPLTAVVGAEGAQIGAVSEVSYTIPERYVPPMPFMFDYCYFMSKGAGITSNRNWQIAPVMEPHENGAHTDECYISGPRGESVGNSTLGYDGPRDGVDRFILAIPSRDSNTGIAVFAPDAAAMAADRAANGGSYSRICPVLIPETPSVVGGHWFWVFVSNVSQWASRTWNTMDRACIRDIAAIEPNQEPFYVPLYGHLTRSTYSCVVSWPCWTRRWESSSNGIVIVGWAEFQPSANPGRINSVIPLDPNLPRPQCIPGHWAHPSGRINVTVESAGAWSSPITDFLGSPIGCWKINGRFTSTTVLPPDAMPAGEHVLAENATAPNPDFARARIKMVG